MVTTSLCCPTCRATRWCGPTAFPRHGPIDAALPRSGVFPAVLPRRDLRHCIQRCYCWSSQGTLHNRQKQQGPTTTATCYVVSVSQAREFEAVEGFYVEVKI